MPLVGERARAALDLHAAGFEPRRQRLERGRVGGLPAEHRDALAAAIAVSGIDDDALLAVVHAERQRRAGLVDALQAEQPGAERSPVAQVLGAGDDISQRGNGHYSSFGSSCGYPSTIAASI